MAVYDKSGMQLTAVYDKNGNPLTLAYDKNGNEIFRGHAISRNITKSTMYQLDMPTGTQGMACDSITQSIAQFYTSYFYMIDLSDGSYKRMTGPVTYGHNTAQFAPTKTEQQIYPLLYVSGDKITDNEVDYQLVPVFEVGSDSYQCVRVYAIPTITGYGMRRLCIDFENSVIWFVYATSYYDTSDCIHIESWSMNDVEEITLSSISSLNPSEGMWLTTNMLSSFTLPWVPEVQAITFFDGMICMLSDRSGAANKYVQFVDVVSQSVYMTIPLNEGGEWEGIDFLYNSETEQYDMILSKRDTTPAEFYRYQFDLD